MTIQINANEVLQSINLKGMAFADHLKENYINRFRHSEATHLEVITYSENSRPLSTQTFCDEVSFARFWEKFIKLGQVIVP